MNADERLGLRLGAYPWYYFIARSGDAGQRWVQVFKDHHGHELTALVDRGLNLLRHRRLEEGRVLLRESAERLEALRVSATVSVVRVLERRLHSGLAYECYLDEDFDGAERNFEIAHQAIRTAIEELPCLVVIALHCYDFRLQRARIARNQARWVVMRSHVAASRAMLENRCPLCVLDNGRSIFVETVDSFHRAIEPRDAEERAALEGLLDTERRRRLLEHTVKDNYALPGVVIPYRPSTRTA